MICFKWHEYWHCNRVESRARSMSQVLGSSHRFGTWHTSCGKVSWGNAIYEDAQTEQGWMCRYILSFRPILCSSFSPFSLFYPLSPFFLFSFQPPPPSTSPLFLVIICICILLLHYMKTKLYLCVCGGRSWFCRIPVCCHYCLCWVHPDLVIKYRDIFRKFKFALKEPHKKKHSSNSFVVGFVVRFVIPGMLGT